MELMKVESGKSKVEGKKIQRREMRTQCIAEALLRWAPLSSREGQGVSWKDIAKK
jgi:hypothetical protein